VEMVSALGDYGAVLVINEAVGAEVTISEDKHDLALAAMAPIKQDMASTRRRNTVLKSSLGRYGAETDGPILRPQSSNLKCTVRTAQSA
jgi:hypothetical protein